MVRVMGMLPIRKLAANRVGLTTYFSKLMVVRSEKKVDNYADWVLRNVQDAVDRGGVITEIKYGKSPKPEIQLPRGFTTMAKRYKQFTLQRDLEQPAFHLNFDYDDLVKRYGQNHINQAVANGEMCCGERDGKLLMMSTSGTIYTPENNKVYGTLEELLGLSIHKAPVDVVELNVMGKAIPIGIVLGYHYGISNLLRKLKVNYRSVVRGARMELTPDEYAVQFMDQSIILSRQDTKAMMVMGSFNTYYKAIAAFNFDEFNNKDVYGAVMDKQGLGSRYAKEIEFMYQAYIDHISEAILRKMGEPTEFGPLLLRAVELLVYDNHPRETSGRWRRERGYERLAGAVFAEMIRGIRRYRSKPLSSRSQVEINPNDVWRRIQSDPSVTIVEESNPIHNLKEKENVTFGGTGGRSSRSLVRRTRAFDPDDLGVISEATVDSSDVAVTTFLSANPQLADLYGTRKDWTFDPTATSSLLSTSALISPCADRDDQLKLVTGVTMYLTRSTHVVIHGLSSL